MIQFLMLGTLILPHNLLEYFLKGGDIMAETIKRVLIYAEKAGTIIVLVAETGKKVMSLCED